MVVKLSKRGWNNVLIFASMFMILLFNYTHKMFVDGEEQAGLSFLLPENSIIQTIDYSGIKFERIGSTWRTVTSIETTNLSAADFADAWLNQEFNAISDAPDLTVSTRKLPVVIWLAGNGQGWIFEVMNDPQQGLTYLYSHQQQTWFELPENLVHQLIPSVLVKG